MFHSLGTYTTVFVLIHGSLRLPDLDYWLTAGVTGQQGMLTPPSTCSQLWHIQGSVFAMHSCLYFFFNYEIYY